LNSWQFVKLVSPLSASQLRFLASGFCPPTPAFNFLCPFRAQTSHYWIENNMKTYITNRFLLHFCALALGIGSSSGLAAAMGREGGERGALERQGVGPSLHAPRSDAPLLPWSQIGAKAGADYQGDGLAVSPTAEGVRLRCVFQRLEGEATREGLWLTSSVTNAVNDRFRVMAAEVGCVERGASERQTVGTSFYAPRSYAQRLPRTGTVTIAGQTVRFTRPGLVEEYSVSMDGVRQDFIIEHPPLNLPVLRSRPGEGGSTLRSTATEDGSTFNQRPGQLAVRLAVSGARVEPAAGGAQLVLPNSGRKIVYSRLRVTDATGKELTARIEVIGHGESQRDSIAQPRVASPRATLGSGEKRANNPERLQPMGVHVTTNNMMQPRWGWRSFRAAHPG
jgi:hypothetical protein